MKNKTNTYIQVTMKMTALIACAILYTSAAEAQMPLPPPNPAESLESAVITLAEPVASPTYSFWDYLVIYWFGWNYSF